jgi:triphosphoribosyl-dephospho-CoA synthetase
LRDALGRGAAIEQAQVHAFFSLLARVSDTNVLYRGGALALERLQRGAGLFLRAGSVFAPDWMNRALALHRSCSLSGVSPGGCADLFAAVWFVHQLVSMHTTFAGLLWAMRSPPTRTDRRTLVPSSP